MDVAARDATPEDLAALTQLATEAIEEKDGTRGAAMWTRQSARTLPPTDSMSADLEDPEAHVVVGTIDDVPVGYGVIRVDHLRDGGRLGVISDLFTLEGARGVSVGEVMMDRLIEHARRDGCFGVDSLALPGDRSTKNFFESFGLVARALIVHRSLDD